MGTQQPKRVAAALALATGLTVFGGMTAHADTPSTTAPNVAPANAPGDVTTVGVTFGPYPNWAVCQAARLAGGHAADPCHQGGDGQWYYVAHT